jgi:integrin alpha FG-GAP repeat containing protein 1
VIDGSIVTDDSKFRGIMPVSIQVGDYNLDGYPDLLVVSKSRSGTHVSLLQSVPCTLGNCPRPAVQAQRRFFVKVENGADDLNKLNRATSAAFFDFDEDVCWSRFKID